MRHTSALVLVAVLAFTALGCDEKLRDFAGPTPNLQATFSSIQRDIFNTTDSAGRVACTQCHNTQFFRLNGNLNLSEGNAYAALVGTASSGKPGATRVIPGDPDNSYLVHKLQGFPDIFGNRMPNTGGPYLTTGQLTIIRRWIQLGAQND